MPYTGPITGEVFTRFLRSELHFLGVIGVDREFRNWQDAYRERYKQAALVVLRSRYQDHEIHVGTPAAAALKRNRWRLIIDVIAESSDFRACVDAAELMQLPLHRMTSSYRPIRFVPGEKI